MTKELKLDWRPLARDGFFYSISIIVFVYAVKDTLWRWYEAFLMVVIYFAYVITLVYDDQVMDYLTKLGNHIEAKFSK